MTAELHQPPFCEATRLSNAYKLAACSHSFCRACLQTYVEKRLRRVLAGDATRARISGVTAALAPRADGPPTARRAAGRTAPGRGVRMARAPRS